jgi:hypothetical protein
MELRDVFRLTGREFDYAEAMWELLHATDNAVEMSPEAKTALALSNYFGPQWADGPGAPITAIAPIGCVLVVEHGKGNALRAWEYLRGRREGP